MQAAKDTFLKTLADRLTVINPARTVMLNGSARPAMMAVENESPMRANTVLETFWLSWEGAGHATPETALMYMDCKLSYGSRGSNAMLRMDRGRIVTAMDGELLQLCQQRSVTKCDYTQTLLRILGTNIFWTLPVMAATSDADGVLLRPATIRLFFFPEVR